MAEESQTLSLRRVCHGALQDFLIWKTHLLGSGEGLLLARRGVEALLRSLSQLFPRPTSLCPGRCKGPGALSSFSSRPP